MWPAIRRRWRPRLRLGASLALLGLAGACSEPADSGFQGYVEGEFVNVAPALAGRLERLSVTRGDEVVTGAKLFVLDAVNEGHAERESRAQLAAAEARWADLKLGRRPPEQAVVRAQIAQAQAEAQRSAAQLVRDEAQFRAGGISQSQLDDTRAAQAVAVARLAQLRSELTVTELPGRGEQVRAQAAVVAAARAALAQAGWRLEQKTVAAPSTGRVFDTLYREGEWVAAGSPVVRMLPPQNVKVRFFVPEAVVGSLAVGRAVSIRCDGCGGDVAAALSYVSPAAEFTPPVIYSNETRGKLVFMVEARPQAGNARRLHPGQPVSVSLR